MSIGNVRTATLVRWRHACTVLLLGLVAVTLLHAAAPHAAAPRHCVGCQLLHTPALAGPPADGAPGIALRGAPVHETGADPIVPGVLRLRPLRAPPSVS